MVERLVLIVGGADTGRAPMAAALLGRIIAREGLGWSAESAGVVGHDGDPAEPEARAAMLALGLDVSGHRARSLSDDLAGVARALIAVDSGVARVLQARYPALATASLGGLAGRARDIPDPFRMQVGAWLQYAGEIEALLTAGLPRLRALVEGGAANAGDAFASAPEPQPHQADGPQPALPERLGAVERAGRILGLVADMPGVLDWAAARAQLEADLAIIEQPLLAGDLARPYVALARSLLALVPALPTAAQTATLRAAVERLRAPITPADLEALTSELARLQAP
ncbi:MAG: low molecular weight phosphatase family protein [Chloroflexales bacterium]|nr:low molecular weight phosphatase family protein [Chloroflexales bacterium]